MIKKHEETNPRKQHSFPLLRPRNHQCQFGALKGCWGIPVSPKAPKSHNQPRDSTRIIPSAAQIRKSHGLFAAESRGQSPGWSQGTTPCLGTLMQGGDDSPGTPQAALTALPAELLGFHRSSQVSSDARFPR